MDRYFYKVDDSLSGIKNIIDSQISNFHPIPCQLLDKFGLVIQVFLAFASFSVLFFKKYFEKPIRTWKVWFMDVSKQGLMALLIHLFNLMISEKMGGNNISQCNWYFMNLITDIIVGTFLNIICLKKCEKIASKYEKYSFKSGDYGSKACWNVWAYQILIWLIINVVVKSLVLIFVAVNSNFFAFLAEFLLMPFESYPKIELVFIMILMPFLLNSFAFWVTDAYLKEQSDDKQYKYKEEESDEQETMLYS